ncbi:hypothetical protein PO909_022456 [Leuciscus waleckii]
MKKGSLIGNIAHDLGLDAQRLRSGRARIVSGDSTEYVELKTDKGILVVKERIDREQLCAETTPCSFTFEIILDNPMELHHVTVEILDVNDHSPTYPKDEIYLEISESAAPGARFLLGSADDPDVGVNGIQNYVISQNENFILKQHSRPSGVKYAEMVLQKHLDREQHPRLSLILTAVDGGSPQRSGNMKIEVNVLDANDNAPVFNQSVYRATIAENSLKGTYITSVNASDADSGANGLFSYSFGIAVIAEIFKMNESTGVITLNGVLDYEKAKKYEFDIEAKDQGGLGDSAKVIVDLIDVNDNAPFISVMSFSNPVSEEAPLGTTIAIFSVKDLDAGDNGHVDCTVDTPFKLNFSLRNYYTLVTDAALDRERVAEYNITITATDSGSPALSSQKTLNLKVSDVNDNPPRFHKTVYTAFVTENNSPGLSIFTLSAQDDDWNQNARISYLLDETTVGGSPVSSFISVNADSGVVHALRGFDYEQMKSVSVCVKAQDGGSPPLSTNVTLDIIIQDQNDNAPQVLYPVQTGGSVVAEIVPRAADVGYLVTKVVAVDVDSGQNAWLSYKLQKATDRALFEVGLQNGEIRTVRQVTDKDAVKQKLTVVVEDNGQPSRSAVVSINVAVADSFPEVLSEFTDFTHEKQYNDNLTFYLVLALAAVSFLFITCVVVIISVKIYRWRQSRFLYQSNLPVIPYYPPHYADTGVTGTLPHGYNYEVCMTTDSRKSDCKFSTLGGQSVLVVDPSFTETMQRAMKENNFLEDPDKCPEMIRYSVPEEMKKGSLIGNIAHDLGLDVQRLRSGRARIVSGDSTEYVELKTDKGILVVKERIDREQLCAETTPCSFTFEIILDNPMELHHVTQLMEEISKDQVIGEIFELNESTGVITLTGLLDYEKAKKYEIDIEAKDQGGLGDSAKVIVDLIDVNDNAPVVSIMSFSSPVTEDATVGTTIAIFSVKDLDAGDNGHVDCTIDRNTPFKLQSSLRNYYTLLTDAALDRERVAEYNITITATDLGSPALSSRKTLNLKVSDVNDNPPRFHKTVYTAFVPENNSPGLSIFTLSAQDDDWNQNARISYLLDETTVGGSPVSSFISVNADSGVVHALRGFDYEQMKRVSVCVKAQDGGSPPLSTNVTLDIIIQDQNDNAPQVLYPVQAGGSVVAEIVPRAADVGYLVTKVVAVDVDSGQNAWLSYKLQKATDRALFEVGLQNGEIRTVRQVTDKDAVKQKLTVVVEDNGQPSRSAVVSINVAVADSFPEVLSEFTDFTHEKQYNDNLTFYLVLALAAVSFLFITCVVVIISVKIYRWRQSRFLFQSNLPVIPYYPPHYADTGVTGTLPHGYNYEVCMTTDSRKSDCKFSTLGGQSVLVVDPSFTETMQHTIKKNNSIEGLGSTELIRYSVPEEMKKGSLIGNIAHDLGLDAQRLRSGRARIVSGDSTEYVELKTDKGILVVKERIDREQLCAETTPCSFTFEIILDNPMELHHVTVEILDVNDHSPTFPNDEISLEISESAAPGALFLLGSADDPDVGLNALQHYTMSPNDYFILKEHSSPDGIKYAEMVLQKPLDRELHPRLSLILTAVDGGNPQRSGNMKIQVTLLDINDNAPVFNQSVYRATIAENAPKGTYITTVNASDADSEANSLISYSFANFKSNRNDIFKIDRKTGVITLTGMFDYERAKKHEIGIEAKDQGGLGNSAKVIVDLIDVNDNAPIISIMSFSSPVTEDATVGTTIAIFSVKDLDAGDNGHVDCTINQNIPFKLQSSLRNYYTLVTDAVLDRERVAEYNITITATDSGSPALSSQKTLNLKVSDVNDNPPRFHKTVYTAFVPENNSPGLSIFTLSAQDDDWNQNARISYLLDETSVGGSPVSSFISVNADSGVVHALRGFDYEQMKSVSVCVKAQDGGSPPLSTNVTLDIIIQDQNDNAPQVLYPVQTGGSVVAEIVPRAADVGYLVTKVVAVDVDSGQNAWLSYKLQKATDRALFEVGLQNGEIRTVRQVTDKDAVKQKLTVVVEDNGQPSRSAVVSINVAVADSFPEVLSEFTDFTHEKQYNDNLTFYLVLALAAVSFLFITCVVVIISVKIYRWRQSRFLFQSNLPVIPYYPPHYADTGVTGTLPHGYNYEVCMTTDSRKSDCKFSTLGGQSVLVVDPSFTETMQRAMKENNFLEDPELQVMVR